MGMGPGSTWEDLNEKLEVLWEGLWGLSVQVWVVGHVCVGQKALLVLLLKGQLI